MYQIGVDIGGTNIKIGLVDDSLEILEQASIPFPHEGAQTVADRLAEAVRGVLSAAGVKAAELQSIGVVIPGSIDPTGEVVINAYNLGFHDVPFKKLIAAHFPNTPIFMANDANGAALAELYKGAFVGCRTAVLLTLGTGLGGGIILNGKMFNGGMNQGTELGHAYLVDGGEHCTCGNNGCMEAYCAASALAREGARAMQRDPRSSPSAAVFAVRASSCLRRCVSGSPKNASTNLTARSSRPSWATTPASSARPCFAGTPSFDKCLSFHRRNHHIMVRIDRSGTETFVQPHTLDKAACKMAIDTLCSGTGAGNDFIGWVDLPVNYDKAEFARIQQAAKKIHAP